MTTTFLDRILATKQAEVEQLRAVAKSLPDGAGRAPGAFRAAIRNGSNLSIISEVKQASPSKGLIQPNFEPLETAMAYERAGAAAISVLTDETYFRGSIHHLELIQQHVSLPVLRKDFIIDEAQIDEAYLAGADAILFIVAALTKSRLAELSAYAQHLGLDVLVEVHAHEELDDALSANPSVLGINNRNLHTFEVSLNTTLDIMPDVPTDVPVISESGVQTAADASRLAEAGVDGLLIGESLMRQPSHAARQQLLHAFAVPRHVRTTMGTGR